MRPARRRSAYTFVELLATLGGLTIILGLMVSLAGHVRAVSADQLTRDILRRLDTAMDEYIQSNGASPAVPSLLPDNSPIPSDAELDHSALLNNQAVVAALNERGLLAGRFDDLSGASFDGTDIRDAWGSPIVFMAHMHPSIGMSPQGWFFFSAGPDGNYLTRADNCYSYDELSLP